jgi:hypothetical protein
MNGDQAQTLLSGWLGTDEIIFHKRTSSFCHAASKAMEDRLPQSACNEIVVHQDSSTIWQCRSIAVAAF